MARLRHADEQAECLLIGVDRKWPIRAQNVEIDPECRTLFWFHSRRSDHKTHRHVPNQSIIHVIRRVCQMFDAGLFG
jgi:hypothetical protein